MEEPKRTCIADQSADTRVLISEISRLERGTVITYEGHFSRWLGKTVSCSADIPTMNTVIKRLKADYGYVLSNVHGEGYKILTHSEVIADTTRRDRIRRHATLRGRDLDAVDVSTIDDTGRMRWAAERTLAHLVKDSTSDKSVKRLEGAVNGAAQPLALAKALDAIKGVAS